MPLDPAYISSGLSLSFGSSTSLSRLLVIVFSNYSSDILIFVGHLVLTHLILTHLV